MISKIMTFILTFISTIVLFCAIAGFLHYSINEWFVKECSPVLQTFTIVLAIIFGIYYGVKAANDD